MKVVHSLLVQDDQILLLFKPSRQKWFLPGGKAEFGENVIQTGCREFFEETGLELKNAELAAVTTVVVEEDEGSREWMLYTVKGTDSSGHLIIKRSPSNIGKASISFMVCQANDPSRFSIIKCPSCFDSILYTFV